MGPRGGRQGAHAKVARQPCASPTLADTGPVLRNLRIAVRALGANFYNSNSDFTIVSWDQNSATACDVNSARNRYPVLDRDPLYTRAFRKMLKDAGVRVVRVPARSPNLNAFAERFVRSVRSECLARCIPLGERHLRHVLTEYVEHYHRERNHQGLDHDLIEQLPANTNSGEGPVRRRE